MSPPAATVASRRRSSGNRQRSVARRRRRLVFCVVAAVAIATAVAMPLFRRAVSELGLPLSYADVIREQAADKHLDPALIAAVIYAETKFDARSSAAGAQGLMQIMPQTAEFLARRSGATTFTTADLSTPSVNIAYGAYYLRYLLDRYGGRKLLALAAYNAGEANVDQWIRQAGGRGGRLTVADIPFAETRVYVTRVLQAQRDYRRTYRTQLGYR